ncbi:Nucleic acid-binding, OB-fold [Sesbania bispinosa]|nr:Nucleic acid-binding, OB-fold [Sesbania bispinosa]
MAAINMIEIPVRDISPNIRPWFITVRVIHMWNTTFCSRISRVLSVEFVVIDAHGDKIQASVSRDILRLKRIDMDEGDFLRVGTVVIVLNDGEDRATRHAYRLVVDMCSMLEKSEPLPTRTFGLSPMNTSEIVRKKNENKFLVGQYTISHFSDKVGLLTSLSSERKYVKDDKDVTFLKNNGPSTPVVVIQFARIAHEGKVFLVKIKLKFHSHVKLENGDISIESVVNITRVHFEPPIPNKFEMINWLIMSGISLEGKLNCVNMDLPSLSLCDEFLLYHSRKRIDQLMKRGQGGLYVVWGRIIGLKEDEM